MPYTEDVTIGKNSLCVCLSKIDAFGWALLVRLTSGGNGVDTPLTLFRFQDRHTGLLQPDKISYCSLRDIKLGKKLAFVNGIDGQWVREQLGLTE